MNNQEEQIKYTVGLDTNNLKIDVEQASSMFSELAITAESQGARIDGAFKNVGSGITSYLSLDQAASFAKHIEAIGVEVQKLERTFTAMLGSAKAGNEMMKQAVDMAAKTPFDLTSVAQGAQQLIECGSQAKNVASELTMLGNIAVGVSRPLGEIVSMYASAQIQGELFTSTIEQFGGAGIPLAQELALQMGVTTERVYELVEAAGVGFPQLQQALQAMTSEGGAFFAVMDGPSEMIEQQVSTLSVAIQEMFSQVEQSQTNTALSITTGTGSMAESYNKVLNVMGDFITVCDAYKAALMVINAYQKASVLLEQIGGYLKMAKSLGVATANQMAFNRATMLNPYLILAVALTALIALIYKFCTAQSAAEKAQERFNDKVEESKNKQDEFMSKSGELTGIIRDETSSRYAQAKAFKELNDKYPGLLDNISMEKLLLMDQAEVQKMIAGYAEEQSKKDLFAGFDDAQEKVKLAQKAIDDYVTSSSKVPGGTSFIQVGKLEKDLEEALSYLAQWQSKMDEHRAIEAEARPVDVKIIDLQKNIDDLNIQLTEMERLQREAKDKGLPVFTYEQVKINILRTEIETKSNNLIVLQDGKTAQETKKKADELKKRQALDEKNRQQQEQNDKALEKLKEQSISNQKKLQSEKTAIEEDGLRKRLAISQQEFDENQAALTREYNKTVAEYAKLNKAVPDEVKTTYEGRLEVNVQKKKANDTKINEDSQTEIAQREKALTDVFIGEENKRLETIRARYEKERVWAKAQVDEGAMTEEQGVEFVAKVNHAEQEDVVRVLLEKYQTYADKRKDIEDKFNAEIVTLTNNNVNGQFNGQIAQAERAKSTLLSSIDKEQVDSMRGSSGMLGKMFEDASEKSVSEIMTITDEAQRLIDYLKNTDTENITPQFGFTAEELKALKGSDSIKDIEKSVSDLKGTVAQKNPFTALGNDISAMFKAGEGDTSLEDKLKKLGGSVSAVANITGNAAGQLSEMFAAAGNEGVAKTLGTVQEVMGSISNIGEGFAKGGVIGGIGAAVGEAAKWMTKAFQAADNNIEKGIQDSQKQIEKLEASYAKLESEIAKVYSSDASKLIKQQNTMLEQQKVLIQNQIVAEQSKKNTDDSKIKAWQQQIEDIDKTLADNKNRAQDAIFGSDIQSAIDDFASAYMDAWASGEDRAQSQKNVVRNMIRGIVQEMVKSNIGKSIQEVRDKIEKAMEDGFISEQEEAEINAAAQKAYDKNEAETKQLDRFLVDDKDEGDQGDQRDQREAQKRGIATASQESVDENNGRLTAIQGHTFEMNEKLKFISPNIESIKVSMDMIRDNAAQQLEALQGIRSNTAPIADMKTEMGYMRTAIETIRDKGLIIKPV